MNDQVILMYVRNDELLPVALSESQMAMLQMMIPAILGGEPLRVVNKPQGKVVNLIEELRKEGGK
jgi:hypothetical protein